MTNKGQEKRRLSGQTVIAGVFALALAIGQLGRAEDLTNADLTNANLTSTNLTNARVPVTLREAWQAIADGLRGRGFTPEQVPGIDDIELPVAVPARAERKLRVTSVCWDADAGRARFRVECSAAGACLPFLVYVPVDAQAPACRIEAAPHPVRASRAIVHTGERATAVLTAAGLRMTATVTCLDRGALGEIIRVRAQEGRTFRARVAGSGLVEALLQ